MRHLAPGAVLCALFAAAAPAQPRITGWQNNYSYALPGSPHYAAAQGSIVVVYGTAMAPPGVLSQGFNPALDRNLGGVSLKVAVGATTTDAIPYYVSPTQIAAILPSATPTGNGTLTVTYNGQTSAGFAIRVVQSAAGILTLNGSGNGGAAAFDANFIPITFTNAANPGQTVIFWGTGLGPDPNDETRLIASPRSLDSLPFEFYIGNRRATVHYRGRSSFPGLDQMNVEIPEGVSGCFVSAYAKTGGFLSNFVTIPVAATGRACSDPTGLPSGEIAGALAKPTVTAGWLYLGKFISRVPDATINGTPIPASTSITDAASAQFLRYTPFDFTNYGGHGQPSMGSCVVTSYFGTATVQPAPLAVLDSGTVTLALPGGALPLAKGNGGSNVLNGTSADNSLFLPDAGGSFPFSGGGGVDVGLFTRSIDTFAPLNWTNRSGIRNVNRAQNLEVTWNGAAPLSYVVISGVSSTSGSPLLSTAFSCVESASAGRFTIPADVLSSLVASAAIPGSTLPAGQLSIANYEYPGRFPAAGLDVTWVSYFTYETIRVNYQ